MNGRLRVVYRRTKMSTSPGDCAATLTPLLPRMRTHAAEAAATGVVEATRELTTEERAGETERETAVGRAITAARTVHCYC